MHDYRSSAAEAAEPRQIGASSVLASNQFSNRAPPCYVKVLTSGDKFLHFFRVFADSTRIEGTRLDRGVTLCGRARRRTRDQRLRTRGAPRLRPKRGWSQAEMEQKT